MSAFELSKKGHDWRSSAFRKAIAVTAFTALAAIGAAAPAYAAKSDGCAGGGFVISGLLDGTQVTTATKKTIAANNVGSSFQVLGKYVEFTVVTSTFGIENYVFTGAASPEDLTGGRRTPVWQSKSPDHRGKVLTSAITVENDDGDIVVSRTGSGVSMKVQAKDCSAGGVFQMEVERGDGTATRITHTLANGVFYFDNPNFRAREGDIVPYKDTTIAVPSRVNIANLVSSKFVARDSSQVATRVNDPTCSNTIKTRTGTAVVQHCGQVSRWDVSSGGRMGFVTGEDSIEVAPPATNCTHKCQAQNRVRGQSVKLNFPFPVPEASKLKPATP